MPVFGEPRMLRLLQELETGGLAQEISATA
jgi:hypothetical protein